MCCLHYKAYIRLLIFCGSRQICFLFFWSNMALSTFWVADPWPRPTFRLCIVLTLSYYQKSSMYALTELICSSLQHSMPSIIMFASWNSTPSITLIRDKLWIIIFILFYLWFAYFLGGNKPVTDKIFEILRLLLKWLNAIFKTVMHYLNYKSYRQNI